MRKTADEAAAEMQQVKAAQETAVSELKGLKKELRAAADKMGAARVKLTQLENDMDQQRGQRQRIFQRARLGSSTCFCAMSITPRTIPASTSRSAYCFCKKSQSSNSSGRIAPLWTSCM